MAGLASSIHSSRLLCECIVALLVVDPEAAAAPPGIISEQSPALD